ncbi:Scr1 family TA system antitoxin-like transcriptional regulator [Nocardiopsis sp. CNR-923]|uniref:Scr1 family TA system antitoxin-like transcriptional regulator n=1 Tax=Nocardiopsis sp. CNR-923 TaxID=1904965 RepID=UPI0021CCB656|nr:Scr1 family TA system antitoxin-like transcriptional regulator [Nocardiopsis sp. CNR-923]
MRSPRTCSSARARSNTICAASSASSTSGPAWTWHDCSTDAGRAETDPGWYEQSDEHEKKATEIRFFHPFVVPGFFQVESRTRVIATHSVPAGGRDSVLRAVQTRKAWRERLRIL